MEIRAWEMVAPGEPLREARRDCKEVPDDHVLVEVAGCGVCHTDLGFLDDGVPTRHELPLVLGHEISGRVVSTGSGADEWNAKEVIVPAVIPCGRCDVCRSGRGSICPDQVFPGNDLDGGFASHVIVPSNGLCDVGSGAPDLWKLSVVADAVTTPYQSIQRSRLGEGELGVFVGIGGVGSFGVQIAAARGAAVVAIDVNDAALERIAEHGAALTLNAKGMEPREIKKAVRRFAREEGLPGSQWKIFETSGTPAGQQTAFSLLVHGAYLGIVGYSPEKVTVPLSHLMAFDARAEGNWGCLPEHYPVALSLVKTGNIRLDPFIERHPMSEINEVLDAVRRHEIGGRPVLVPDFE